MITIILANNTKLLERFENSTVWIMAGVETLLEALVINAINVFVNYR